jgi:hypothetical protein
MPQTSVIPEWKATYPILEPRQKPSSNPLPTHQHRVASAAAWATGVVTLTLPASTDFVGSKHPIVVSGFTPAAYNGNFTGTIASATTITYPLTANPGVETALGAVDYDAYLPIGISTALPANAVPNKAPFSLGTIQSVSVMAGADPLNVLEEMPSGKPTWPDEEPTPAPAKK